MSVLSNTKRQRGQTHQDCLLPIPMASWKQRIWIVPKLSFHTPKDPIENSAIQIDRNTWDSYSPTGVGSDHHLGRIPVLFQSSGQCPLGGQLAPKYRHWSHPEGKGGSWNGFSLPSGIQSYNRSPTWFTLPNGIKIMEKPQGISLCGGLTPNKGTAIQGPSRGRFPDYLVPPWDSSAPFRPLNALPSIQK